MKNKSYLLFFAALIVCLVYFGITGGGNKGVRVVIHSPFVHVVADSFIKGAKDVFLENGYKFGKNMTLDIENGQGDNNANQVITKKISKEGYDVYVTMGTQVSQSLVNHIKDKPIVFGAVTDPVFAKLVTNISKPGENVSGTMDTVDYESQIKTFLKVVPSVKKIAILYNPGEPNAVANLKSIKGYENIFGVEFVAVPVNTTNDIYSAARSVVGKVDAFYGITDTTVVSGEESLIRIALENKKPYYAVESSGVEKGALMSLSANYEKIGRNTAKIVVRILNGEKVGDIPVKGLGVEDTDVYLNQKTADRLGIKFPEELVKQAKEIYR